MSFRSGQVIDEYARPVSGASIYVYSNATGDQAVLTSDGVTPLGQPVITDEFGVYSYWATDDFYREDTWFAGKKRFAEVVPVGNPGADLLLRSDLATSAGAGLLGWIQSGVGAVARTIQDKLRGTIDVKDFGAVDDGVINADGTFSGTDNSASIQAAFTAAATKGKRIRGGGLYRCASRITIANRIQLDADGFTAETSSSSGIKRPLGGMWLLFDHTDIGLYLKDDANPNDGKYFSRIDGLGTARHHAAPAGGWAPTVCGPDFHIEQRVHFGRIFTLNPYIAARVDGPGVLSFDDWRGQPLFIGIDNKKSTDIQKWGSVHFWPYWSQDANVVAYTINNATALKVERQDGVVCNSWFSWGYKWNLDHTDSLAAGSGMAGFHFDRFYTDKAGGGVRFTTNSFQAFGKFVDLLHNSDSAVGSSGAAVEFAGSAACVVDTTLTVTRSHDEVIKLAGAAHALTVRPMKIEAWDRRSLGAFAFNVANGAKIRFAFPPRLASGTANVYTTASGALIGEMLAVGPVGYAVGAGASITQLTSKVTAVQIDKPCGQITMSNSALAAGATATVDVTDSFVVDTDTIEVNLQGGQATLGTYRYWVEKVLNGHFYLTVENRSAGSLSEALVFNYSVIKAVKT